MELSTLSSNWKKLQKQLKDQTPTNNGSFNKRKRSAEDPSIPTEAKKVRKAQHSGKSNSRRPRETKMDSDSRAGRARSASAPDQPIKHGQEGDSTYLRSSLSSTNLKSPRKSSEVNEGNSNVNVAGKFIALDCEMVGIGPDPNKSSQVARVSLVNFHGEQVYDSYVLPKFKVTDYRTSVSGITKDLLADGRSFEEVQDDVRTLLKGRILVGHAVKNDLTVLDLPHPRAMIRDTAFLKPWRERISNGGKPSLRVLARDILGWRDFQESAHNSVEDARAAMALFRVEKDAFEAKAQSRNSEVLQTAPKAAQTRKAKSRKAAKGAV